MNILMQFLPRARLMESERRESAHVTNFGTAYCLNRDIRTRHNDNDDALFFFS
jgi:hypothetical protein